MEKKIEGIENTKFKVTKIEQKVKGERERDMRDNIDAAKTT